VADVLILASVSPRRHELLAERGIAHEIVPSGIDEDALPAASPREFVRAAARAKAEEVARRFPGRLVLGADTVIAFRGEVIGKPGTPARTRAVLARLSGETHEVLTGIALVRAAPAWSRDAVVSSTVTFRPLGPEDIEWYVATGEGDDKAGGYAIQGKGARLISGTAGSFTNIVGLPMEAVLELLGEAGGGRSGDRDGTRRHR
jgi:septum formation protein